MREPENRNTHTRSWSEEVVCTALPVQQLYHFLDALGLPERSEGFPGSVLMVSTRGAVGTKLTSPLQFGHALHLPELHQNPGTGPKSVQAPGTCHQLKAPRPDSSGVCHSFFLFQFLFFFFSSLNIN